MSATAEIAARIAIENAPGIDTLEILSMFKGNPSYGSSQTVYGQLVYESIYLEGNEYREWPPLTVLDVTIPGSITTQKALPWGGFPHPVWFKDHPQIANVRAFGGILDPVIMQGVIAGERDYVEKLKPLPRAEQERILSELAAAAQSATPPRENRRENRTVDVVMGRGNLDGAHVVVQGTGAYLQTGLIQAFAAHHLVHEPPRAVGFRLAVRGVRSSRAARRARGLRVRARPRPFLSLRHGARVRSFGERWVSIPTEHLQSFAAPCRNAPCGPGEWRSRRVRWADCGCCRLFRRVSYVGACSDLGRRVGWTARLTLQTVATYGHHPFPDWVSHLAEDAQGHWQHTTIYKVPAHTLVKVTIYQYDGDSGLRNPFLAQVRGTVGGVERPQREGDQHDQPRLRGAHLHDPGPRRQRAAAGRRGQREEPVQRRALHDSARRTTRSRSASARRARAPTAGSASSRARSASSTGSAGRCRRSATWTA